MAQTTKYDYPPGLDSKEKKRFRVQMRKQAKELGTQGKELVGGIKPLKAKSKTKGKNGKGKVEGNQLIFIHKKVLNNYLHNQTELENSEILRIKTVYDQEIDYTNIHRYYYNTMEVFTKAIRTGKLSSIAKYK